MLLCDAPVYYKLLMLLYMMFYTFRIYTDVLCSSYGVFLSALWYHNLLYVGLSVAQYCSLEVIGWSLFICASLLNPCQLSCLALPVLG